jgi:hypothetical protein
MMAVTVRLERLDGVALHLKPQHGVHLPPTISDDLSRYGPGDDEPPQLIVNGGP